jgi:hypothetical protein
MSVMATPAPQPAFDRFIAMRMLYQGLCIGGLAEGRIEQSGAPVLHLEIPDQAYNMANGPSRPDGESSVRYTHEIYRWMPVAVAGLDGFGYWVHPSMPPAAAFERLTIMATR